MYAVIICCLYNTKWPDGPSVIKDDI